MSIEVVAPKKSKVSKPKAPKAAARHPAYGDMVKAAVTDLKEKKGSSRAAIVKYILQNYKVGDNLTSVNSHLRIALKRGVATGALKQTKGVGASGSFRIGESKKVEGAKKPKPSPKKPKSPKKAAAPKAKKPKASPKKKAAVKPKKPASPKKAKQAGKAKSAKKSSPKAKKVAG